MAKAAPKNERCPFRDECEKKCEYKHKELECSYYKNNANDDNFIPDQEEIRRAKDLSEMRKEEALFIANMDLDDVDDELLGPMVTTSVNGELSDVAVVRNIGLGYIIPSQDNFFNVESDITELAEDIKLNGLLSPLTICPSGEEGFFRLISGHRRYKALCSIHDNSFEVPCLVVAPRSKEAEEYMLIRSNLAARELTWNEKEEARKRIEALLLNMKAQGVEFPGKLRSHVAQLLKTSEAQLAKSKYIAEHTIQELKDIPDERISFNDRYIMSHWSEEMQKQFYEERVKDKIGWVCGVGYADDRIKEGKNPFIKIKEESIQEAKIIKCFRVKEDILCSNAEKFVAIKGVSVEAPGITFKCDGYCCRYCSFRYICPNVCAYTQSCVDISDQDDALENLYGNRARKVLKDLLVLNGVTYEKLKEIEDSKEFKFQEYVRDFFTDPFSYTLDINDLFYLLNMIKVPLLDFFTMVKECDYLADVVAEDESYVPSFEIYLGEDGENK